MRRSKYCTQRLFVKCIGQWNGAEFGGGNRLMIGLIIRSESRKFEQRGKWVVPLISDSRPKYCTDRYDMRRAGVWQGVESCNSNGDVVGSRVR